MNYVLEEVLNNIGPSLNDLSNDKLVSKMHELFPVPREQEILWAAVDVKGTICGLIITEEGIFLKAPKEQVKQANRIALSDDEKVNSIYHYIKWDYFDIDDFQFESLEGNDFVSVYYGERKLFDIEKKYDFFDVYSKTYKDIIKEATVSAENIFTDLETIVPANFSRKNTKTGHGQMAEEALTLMDKFQGKDAKVVGRDNRKNGPDRIVDGIEIQTKYHATGRSCINDCFDKESGLFRYYDSKGKPMVIEVPKDKYAEAINEFRTKILENKVPGVKNPNDASKYIKEGQLTYKQALNLTKPGTIDSLKYDAATGAINCSFAFGLSFLATFIISYSKNGNRKEAMGDAFASGIQVFGLSFFTHVLTMQVARTSVTKQLIPASTYIVEAIGPKATQTIVNAIRFMAGKAPISGAAAMKQLAKMFRSNVVASAVTFVVFSAPGIYNTVKKKISKAQYTKNMLSLVGSILSGSAGAVGSSVAAAKIAAMMGTVVAPGVGTAIGAGGGLLGGIIGNAALKPILDSIREDDTIILSRMFNGVMINLIYEYLLSENEIDVVIEKLNAIKAKEYKELFGKVLSSENQEKVIDKFLRHYFEEIIRSRPKIEEPTPADLIDILTEIDNAVELKGLSEVGIED